jgi:predicted RNA binding protein YcfA (HicA-like mRNA interferase family)
VFLHHPHRGVSVVVPLHRELRKGTLNNIIKKAGLSRDALKALV